MFGPGNDTEAGARDLAGKLISHGNRKHIVLGAPENHAWGADMGVSGCDLGCALGVERIIGVKGHGLAEHGLSGVAAGAVRKDTDHAVGVLPYRAVGVHDARADGRLHALRQQAYSVGQAEFGVAGFGYFTKGGVVWIGPGVDRR